MRLIGTTDLALVMTFVAVSSASFAVEIHVRLRARYDRRQGGSSPN